MIKNGHIPCKQTIGLLRHWWHRFNREIFDGELRTCQITMQPEEDPSCVGSACSLGQGYAVINIPDQSGCAKAYILGLLLHEMVHQFQIQHGDSVHHGITFSCWRDPILGVTGLTIGEYQ